MTSLTAFIGGGNMATAILGGLIRQGRPGDQILVLDPNKDKRERLAQTYGVQTRPEADEALASADTVIWAIKPQHFKAATEQIKPFLGTGPAPLIVSVVAGIRAADIARWLDNDRIVRVMPNTPALAGQGMTGMVALPSVSNADRQVADALLHTVGETLWVKDETALDGVTAISGSGPAYVFYFIEALEQAAAELGFTPEDGRRLAIATVAGSAALAAQSTEPASVLRERVTSKGGTTFAALTHLNTNHVREHIVEAIHKAAERSRELGDEFGRD